MTNQLARSGAMNVYGRPRQSSVPLHAVSPRDHRADGTAQLLRKECNQVHFMSLVQGFQRPTYRRFVEPASPA